MKHLFAYYLAVCFTFCIAQVVQAQHAVCSGSAWSMSLACSNETRDDFAESMTVCVNIVNEDDRSECYADAADEMSEQQELCSAQAAARAQLCTKVGEAAYDQSEFWEPENFVDVDDIGGSVAPNTWFDLTVGNRKVLTGDGEVITVIVTDETKLIKGINCRTVNDLVTEDGLNIEDTDDWYAQDIDGNVWYCGEIALNFKFFEGDEPEEAEVVDIEGSWKAFRDGAQPGILVHANPVVGATYRQEVFWGDAEDVAEVLTVTASGLLEGDGCESEAITAAVSAYADEVCDGDCLVTLEYSPVEPGVFAHKYYAPGSGIFLEAEDGVCIAIEGVIEEDEEDEEDENDEGEEDDE